MDYIGDIIVLTLVFIAGVITTIKVYNDMVIELENDCIVYENNVYCKEVSKWWLY